ncbi:MAG: PEP-CTERM sorting domain-containing protein [Planctomycetota bacterium]
MNRFKFQGLPAMIAAAIGLAATGAASANFSSVFDSDALTGPTVIPVGEEEWPGSNFDTDLFPHRPDGLPGGEFGHVDIPEIDREEATGGGGSGDGGFLPPLWLDPDDSFTRPLLIPSDPFGSDVFDGVVIEGGSASPSNVPSPGTIGLLAAGAMSVGVRRRRR